MALVWPCNIQMGLNVHSWKGHDLKCHDLKDQEIQDLTCQRLGMTLAQSGRPIRWLLEAQEEAGWAVGGVAVHSLLSAATTILAAAFRLNPLLVPLAA